MKKIGFLYGSARNFPEAVIRRINQNNSIEATAEPVILSQVLINQLCPYDLVIDLISHQIPFYTSYLKSIALQGIPVYTNPLKQVHHDQFYQSNLIASLGYAVPKSALLPSYQRPDYTNDNSFSNLAYPLDWQSIIGFVGLPAYLKLNHLPLSIQEPVTIHTLQELWDAQHATSNQVTILQEIIKADVYYSCYSIGDNQHRIISFDPSKPPHLRYAVPTLIDTALEKQLIAQARRINRALGYECNRIQFAISNQIPYVVDAFHMAFNDDIYTLGPDHFEWLVESTANWVLSKTEVIKQKKSHKKSIPTTE